MDLRKEYAGFIDTSEKEINKKNDKVIQQILQQNQFDVKGLTEWQIASNEFNTKNNDNEGEVGTQ